MTRAPTSRPTASPTSPTTGPWLFDGPSAVHPAPSSGHPQPRSAPGTRGDAAPGPSPDAARCRGFPEAVLSDRDGTLVVDVPYHGNPARVELMPSAREAVDVVRRQQGPALPGSGAPLPRRGR
ncbi:hypothetical protein [Streptomyces sp. NPDC055287]